MRTAWLTYSVLLLLAGGSRAQEFIPLDDNDLARLGLVFAPVTEPDRRSGSRFPATVINSPESASEVAVPYQGTLERWHAAPGDRVMAGQSLATLRSQEVLDLQNLWLTTSAEHEHAGFFLNRDTQLFEKGIISGQRLQETEHELHRMTIELNSLTGALARAGFDVPALEALVENPERLGVYTLRAPVSGILTKRSLMAGQYADKFQVVAALGSGGDPWLRASVPARYASRIEAGQVLSLAGVAETVTVRFREQAVHETTQTLEVLAEFNEPMDYLPGQILSLVIPAAASGVLVPGDAVVHSGEDTIVFVRTSGGVEARILDLEPAGSNYVAGPSLRVGDQLVIQGAAVLKGVQLGLGRDE
ncbi:MAG: efflux RND transporter periplasmic adaptor subunit [Pseudomonadales bacterium]|nr:efflux RND transporter periplasmic adaptor subunit [Pseudomonadales bacterium]